MTDNGYLQEENLLINLLLGHFSIKCKPWKPSKGDRYYAISPKGNLNDYYWINDVLNLSSYKLGNCYKTAQEAESNRDKWVKFYTSDEVLEV